MTSLHLCISMFDPRDRHQTVQTTCTSRRIELLKSIISDCYVTDARTPLQISLYHALVVLAPSRTPVLCILRYSDKPFASAMLIMPNIVALYKMKQSIWPNS